MTSELYLTRDVKSPPSEMLQNHCVPPTRLPTGPSLKASSPTPPQDNGRLGTLVQEGFPEHLDENPTWTITEDQRLRLKTVKLILSQLQRMRVQNQPGCGPSEGSRIEPVSLPVPASRSRFHSWRYLSPSSKSAILHLCMPFFSNHIFLRLLSPHPLLRTIVIISTHLDNPG